MVSYAELCQAIERWQRSQGRESPYESSLSQAMWRKFIEHNAPAMDFQFPQDQGSEELGAAAEAFDASAAHLGDSQPYDGQYYEEDPAAVEHSQEPLELGDPMRSNDSDYAATGS